MEHRKASAEVSTPVRSQQEVNEAFAEMIIAEQERDSDVGTAETTANIEEQELEKVVAPERDSNPQLEWPESDQNGHISEHDYNLRLNYRLTVAGFILDAALSHIDTDPKMEEWVELKRVVMEAKSGSDVYSKVDVVIALENVVYDFALQLGTTDAEYQAARSGN